MSAPPSAFSFLDLVSVNIGAFDDPWLIRLDDKVMLHRLLTKTKSTNYRNSDNINTKDHTANQRTRAFWPPGYILSSTKDDKQRHSNDESFRLLPEKEGGKKLVKDPKATTKTATTTTDESNTTANNKASWILKERAGYGSHGNVVVSSLHEAWNIYNYYQQQSQKGNQNYEVLLQRMVEPPLLLRHDISSQTNKNNVYNNNKFSLRIYVVYFGARTSSDPPEVFLSREGLVKVALDPLPSSSSSTPILSSISTVAKANNPHEEEKDRHRRLHKIHMTNSGRETNMRQEDLNFLEVYLEEQHLQQQQQNGTDSMLRKNEEAVTFESVWKRIAHSVVTVMSLFHNETKASTNQLQKGGDPEQMRLNSTNTGTRAVPDKLHWRYRLAQLCIPKILGFDFVLDAHGGVWLVEINRFPGLEPRNEMDRNVKQRVVHAAWRAAAKLQQQSQQHNDGGREKSSLPQHNGNDNGHDEESWMSFFLSAAATSITEEDSDDNKKDRTLQRLELQ